MLRGPTRRGFLQAAVAFQQDLHLLLGLAQRRLAVAGQADALFEAGQRVFQRQLAALQALHQLLQLGKGLFEIECSFLAGHGGNLSSAASRKRARH